MIKYQQRIYYILGERMIEVFSQYNFDFNNYSKSDRPELLTSVTAYVPRSITCPFLTRLAKIEEKKIG